VKRHPVSVSEQTVPAQKVTNEKGAIVIKTRFAAIFLAMTLGICSMPQASDAQRPRKIPRVAFFVTFDCTDKTTTWQAFENGLREGGYNIGQNIAVDCRSFSPERDDLVREIARNLVRENVDVIVTPGTQVTLAVKQETNSIPIVMVAVGDPVGVGLVASLARPGGNITGLSNMMPDVAGKRLEILKEIAPDATRIAILFNPANAGNVLDVKATEAAARTMGLTTHSLEVRAPSDFVNAFSSMTRERDNALFVSSDPLISRYQQQIVALAAESKIPAIYAHSNFPKVGGLMAYAADLDSLFARAGSYVADILKGAKPADMPVEQPNKFRLIINLKTAKALSLTIPPSLFIRAEEVIE
jgi:putative tryptophan/tyrosine transport system substrate-binding protein